MHTIRLKDDYIKLGQALKAAGVVESGVDAKFAVQDGLVKVNGQTETQRGKKLVSGDKVEYDGETIVIAYAGYYDHQINRIGRLQEL